MFDTYVAALPFLELIGPVLAAVAVASSNCFSARQLVWRPGMGWVPRNAPQRDPFAPDDPDPMGAPPV